MITYDDWTERYLLYDYLNILEISDEIFLSFIENCLHPLVTSDDKKVNRLVNFFNTVLAAEEYQLEVVALRTGRPVYRSMKYKPNLQNTLKDPVYEVVLSYAGEDREYVELVADFLRKNNVKVFNDKFEEVAVWGKDLSELLANVYGGDAQYCVMFISKSYAEKAWTTHEKRNAMAKAVNEKTEYILPVRFDNTDLPGLVPSIAYVDLKKKTSNELGKMILQKLGKLTR